MRTAGSIGPVEHCRKAAVQWLPFCRRTRIARASILVLLVLLVLLSLTADDSSNVQELVPDKMWRVQFTKSTTTTCYADELSVARNLILLSKTR